MDKVFTALSVIPATAWTAIGTALIAFFGVWLTNWNNRQSLKMQLEHEERLHRQRQSKEKLEELYGLVNDWGNAIYLDCEGLEKLAKKQITLEIYQKHVASPKMPQCDLGRIEMITGIYGHSLTKVFEDATAIKNEIASINDFVVQAQINGESSTHLALKVIALQCEFINCISFFKEVIIKAAKEA